MKPGTTTITPASIPGFPPTVNVGDNDRAVRVAFGSLTIYLSNLSDPTVVIVRAEGHDARGNTVPVETRGATDVRSQVEYRAVAGE